jgi:hypothetical protein
MDNKVKKTNNTSFAKLIADNRFLMVLSIAIAFALWLWVAIEKSPEIEVVISGIPVNVDYEKIYDQYNQLEPFGDQTFTINVTVKGKKYIVEALDKDDIIALADTTDISGAGTSTLQVYVSQKEKNAKDVNQFINETKMLLNAIEENPGELIKFLALNSDELEKSI